MIIAIEIQCNIHTTRQVNSKVILTIFYYVKASSFKKLMLTVVAY